ncbi:MAG: DUF1592 domain-containing protein [Myxococcota bacterium]
MGAPVDLGATPLARLTNFEYDNTVRDLLGVDLRLAAEFTGEPRAPGFDFDNNATILSTPQLLVEQYGNAATRIAAAAVANLTSLLPCAPAGAEAACGRQFVDQLLRRAFRRPPMPDERDRYRAFFADNLAAYDFGTSARMFVEAVLQSPQFLYREEVGDVAGKVGSAIPLTSHELASRLSYLLWRSMPDAELFAAADANLLLQPDALASQVERMLEDPRVQESVDHFHAQWLHLEKLDRSEKDATLHPEFTNDLRASMREETLRFTRAVWQNGGSLDELLTGDFTFVDDRLREHYGMSPRNPGSALWQRVPLGSTSRGGVLTQASILSLTAHAGDTFPTNRGKLVREQLLCMPMAPPPPGVSADLGAVPADLPVREKLVRHATDGSCASCHRLMDPIGFGFEGFGPTGAERTQDRWGNPVETHGELIGTGDIDGTFANPKELAGLLASSTQTQECAVIQMFQFGYGRRVTRADGCTVKSLRDQFAASGGSLRELVTALTTTHAFRYRVPVKE